MVHHWVLLCCSTLALAVRASSSAEGASSPESVQAVYGKLRDLHLRTALVGVPKATALRCLQHSGYLICSHSVSAMPPIRFSRPGRSGRPGWTGCWYQ
jgi:hypothetical protein